MTKDKFIVYGDSRSGNCYKIKLLCSQLGIAYQWREVDILAGDTRTAEFLAMNANGKIPLLALPDGRHLAESNAILAYLADGSDLAGRTGSHVRQFYSGCFLNSTATSRISRRRDSSFDISAVLLIGKRHWRKNGLAVTRRST